MLHPDPAGPARPASLSRLNKTRVLVPWDPSGAGNTCTDPPPTRQSPPPRNPSGAGHGALGGSFRPAPHRTAARTAELRGNRRAHPGCRPERSSQSAKTGSSCCARSGGPRRSRRSGDGVDADVRVCLEQRGQAGDDLGGEELAAQVRAGLLGERNGMGRRNRPSSDAVDPFLAEMPTPPSRAAVGTAFSRAKCTPDTRRRLGVGCRDPRGRAPGGRSRGPARPHHRTDPGPRTRHSRQERLDRFRQNTGSVDSGRLFRGGFEDVEREGRGDGPVVGTAPRPTPLRPCWSSCMVGRRLACRDAAGSRARHLTREHVT